MRWMAAPALRLWFPCRLAVAVAGRARAHTGRILGLASVTAALVAAASALVPALATPREAGAASASHDLPAVAMGPVNVAGGPVLDARLRYLRGQQQVNKAPLGVRDLVPITLRFAAPPDAATLGQARAAGAQFYPEVWRGARAGGRAVAAQPGARAAVPTAGAGRAAPASGAELAAQQGILGARTIFPATVAWADLDQLAALPAILRVEASWSPQPRIAPLYQTRAMVGAEAAWQLHDAQDRPLLGTGVVIGDVDTGVDVYHPDFWRADGPSYSWIDVDDSGTLTDGDAVDLNGNLAADAGETVRWLDAPGNAPGQAGVHNPTIDHVYLDANGNGVRDFGPPAFGETDPTFGERVLRGRDLDSDGVLEPGEPLVALQSCKVLAVYQTDDTVRRLGVDLMGNEGDTFGHGTNVASILAGGEPGRWFGGLAPGASLLFANITFQEDPPFVTPLDVRMAWLVSQGADVILYEDGEWIWHFLDGSDNVEQLLDEYAAMGVIQVAAAGNLATGGMHWKESLGVATGDSVVALLHSASSTSSLPITKAWGQFYWIPRANETVEVALQTPNGHRLVLGATGQTVALPGYDVYAAADLSPRGTYRVDFGLALSADSTTTRLDGQWRFVLRRTGASAGSPLAVHAMSFDNRSGWFGSTTWGSATMEGTVTWPATADSAIVAAAYNPAGGALNNFSGRGPRVDGRNVIDVTAPGSITYTAYRNQDRGGVPGGYGAFGGTSAATPHVAASCALLRQWNPYATQGQIRHMLRLGAIVDGQTGAVPNDDWGYGKLQVYQAALVGPSGTQGEGDTPGSRPPERGTRPIVAPNVPNPFNPATSIRYELPHAGDVVVEIFDLAGRRVATLRRGSEPAGAHAVRWNGADDAGTRVGSGVYLVLVGLDGEAAARKIALIK